MTRINSCPGNGKGRINTASTSENIATLMPIPSARIPIAGSKVPWEAVLALRRTPL